MGPNKSIQSNYNLWLFMTMHQSVSSMLVIAEWGRCFLFGRDDSINHRMDFIWSHHQFTCPCSSQCRGPAPGWPASGCSPRPPPHPSPQWCLRYPHLSLVTPPPRSSHGDTGTWTPSSWSRHTWGWTRAWARGSVGGTRLERRQVWKGKCQMKSTKLMTDCMINKNYWNARPITSWAKN